MSNALVASLSMRLGKLPDFATVGGNARVANRGHRISVYERERDGWIAAIREAGTPYEDDRPYFAGPVELRATLHLPTARTPDYENAIFAMKTLVDLLEVRRTRWTGKRGSTKGMLGWVRDDAQIVWPWLVYDETKSPMAPLTVIELRAVEYEQKTLV